MGIKHQNLVIALFVFSGFSSLIFQSVWVRVLSLAVGSTSTAMSLVLSIFFFGLALGSYLAGRYSKKIKNSLWVYGLLEGIIGLYAMGLIYVLLGFHQILAFLPMIGPYAIVGNISKFALVFLLLVLPTVGMGASLPLLIRLFVDDKKQTFGKKSNGSLISLLYGINTLGAVLGAFSASFFFIPEGGLLVANHLAASTNVVVLLVAAVLTIKFPSAYQVKNIERSTSVGFYFRKLTHKQWALLSVCLMSGFASIGAEVVWNKYLGIFFGTNTYGLGIILSIFLLGISAGSLLLSWQYHRIRNKEMLQINLLLVSVAMLLVTSYLLNLAPVVSGGNFVLSR